MLLLFLNEACLPSRSNAHVVSSAIIITISWGIVVTKARAFAHVLESCASKFHEYRDGPMLDCTDKNLLEEITQSALHRGKRSLENAASDEQPTPNGTRAAFYNGRSSSCDSFNSIESTSNETSATILQKPQQMMQQAAEVSSNKGPVLTLEPHYILKPLSLSHMYKDDLKEGKKDKTKLYRGVREIAFYETLTNAPNLSTVLTFDEDKSFRSKWNAMRFINELRSNAASFPGSCITYEGIWFLFHVVKDLSTSRDAWNRLVFLLAHYSGDKVVISAFKSYIGACISLANTVDSLNKMAVFTPNYFGLVDLKSIDTDDHSTHTTKNEAPSHPYLLLEDITINYRHPNVIDLKMGTQTYEPSAPDSKKRREVQKYTKQEEFGFRIEGMRFYDESTNGYICQGKRFGTGLITKDQVVHALRMFLCCSGTDTICSSTVDSIMRQLIEIRDWFQDCNSDIAIYTGSILIVHEGSSALMDEAAPPAVKMIDYEHVCRRKGGDEGYLKGIHTLLSMLNEIRSTTVHSG